MSNVYDIAIIGGGIQGVGIAQAAVAAGYSAVLFEQEQLAAGTSSRSSKLIHGGLRYLESAQLSLVRKALLERALLVRIAPELVRLVPFYIPIFPETGRQSWQIRAGLSLYSALGNFSSQARFKKLNKASIENLALKDKHSVKAVYQYMDGQTDDRALTCAVMQSALELGAEFFCPARVINIDYLNNIFSLNYDKKGQQGECQARVVINASGPWVNDVLSLLVQKVTGLDIDLVQGTHIIIDEPDNDGIYYVEAPQDRRAVFVMPWQGKTMVGTTETDYRGDPADTKPTTDEIEYLQSVYRNYFAGNERVVDSFSGLRVLPRTGHQFFHRPRDTILYQHPENKMFISIYGGKLTGYRATAQQLMKNLRDILPERKPIADTAKLMLTPVNRPLC